jgi:invasion protein IalB
MTSDAYFSRASMGALLVLAALGLAAPTFAQAPATPPAPAQAPAQDAGAQSGWRVECSGDGKTLDCRAVQQMINRDEKQLVVQLVARINPETKAPALGLQLPLGINLAEPIQIKVDGGAAESYPVQTCTAAGCFVTFPLKDPLLASMRKGTTLRITVFDTNKRPITIDAPLLGFGLAYDKATK